MKEIRLNKYISESGFCSRREADMLIVTERVTVNGKAAEIGMKVSLSDKVRIDGEILKVPVVGMPDIPHRNRPSIDKESRRQKGKTKSLSTRGEAISSKEGERSFGRRNRVKRFAPFSVPGDEKNSHSEGKALSERRNSKKTNRAEFNSGRTKKKV